MKSSGCFDHNAFLKYVYRQQTNDSYVHSVSCKTDKYESIEVENQVDGLRMAIVCYAGGDQDGVGC